MAKSLGSPLLLSAFPQIGSPPRTEDATCRASRSSQRAGCAFASRTLVSSVSACAWANDSFAPLLTLTTPPAPRDLISIEIANHSTTLVPVLRIFDQERRMTDWGRIAHEPGASLQLTIAPAPNTTLYLQVSGLGHSGGAYTLLARPQKAFDAYEPNDEISNARRIPVGTAVAAGIMDANDTDYYSFVSPRTGTVSIAIANRSTTLIPALSTFEPDMRPSGSAPDVGTPGLNLKHTIQVRENQTYYIQVRPLNNTAGDYTLMIE